LNTIKVPQAKRVWFITDTHLGVRNNSNEWIEIMEDYFFKWFFPLIRDNYQPGDILIHCGDWFDSRQSVNLKVLNLGVSIAEEMSSIFKDGIHILIGNHDIWGKNSNDVNSLKSIKWIPGFNIHEEPVSLNLGGTSFFMMPWRKDQEAETQCLIETSPHDYLCCHADIKGLNFNKFVKVEHGIEEEYLKKFRKIYSGHIHYAQDYKNVKMLGSPYQLTRSDMGNTKGITLLDLSDGSERFFENKFSPKFQKIDFNRILEMTISDASQIFSNNFVDILIDPKMALRAPLNILTDEVTTPRKISFHPHDPNQAGLLSDKIRDTDGSNFSVIDFIDAYVEGLEYDEQTKSKLIRSIKALHNSVANQNGENSL